MDMFFLLADWIGWAVALTIAVAVLALLLACIVFGYAQLRELRALFRKEVVTDAPEPGARANPGEWATFFGYTFRRPDPAIGDRLYREALDAGKPWWEAQGIRTIANYAPANDLRWYFRSGTVCVVAGLLLAAAWCYHVIGSLIPWL